MPRLDPYTLLTPYEEMLGAVRTHVEKYGHRRFYSVHWPTADRIGFTCLDCEEADVEFTVTLDKTAVRLESQATEFVGPMGRDAFEKWLASIPSPHDQLRELPTNAWQYLLTEKD